MSKKTIRADAATLLATPPVPGDPLFQLRFDRRMGALWRMERRRRKIGESWEKWWARWLNA